MAKDRKEIMESKNFLGLEVTDFNEETGEENNYKYWKYNFKVNNISAELIINKYCGGAEVKIRATLDNSGYSWSTSFANRRTALIETGKWFEKSINNEMEFRVNAVKEIGYKVYKEL